VCNIKRALARAIPLATLAMVASMPALAKQYKSAEIFTTDSTLYGKYVFRMKAAEGSGVISNFFLWKDGSELSDVFWEEVDIEVFGKNGATSWQSNLITGLGNRQTSEEVHNANYSFADGYHTFAIEWTPNQVRFLVDDVLIRETKGAQASDLVSPAQARFNFWPPNVTEWVGPLDTSILPAHMFVNWMEYYEWNGQSFNLAWRDDFNSFDTSRWGTADWTFDENQADFSPDNVTTRNGYLVLSMTREGQEGFYGTPPVDTGDIPPVSSSSSSDSSVYTPSSRSSSSSFSVRSSSSAAGTNGCANINVYPNWTAKDWSGGPSNHANSGDQMVYQNTLYKANWYTTTVPGSDGSWTKVGTCGSINTPSSSSIAHSSVSSAVSSVVSIPKSSSSSIVSSTSTQCKEMCQWYNDAPRPLCENTASGWGWENNQSCIGRTTCASQQGGSGIVSNCTTSSAVSSSSAVTVSSSSQPGPISSSSSSVVSSSSSSATSVGAGQFRINSDGRITKNGEVFPVRCGSWFGLEGQHEPKDAENNPDGAPMELYAGNMWWAGSGQGTGRDIQQTMEEITALGINTIRLPIAPQTLDPNDPQGTGFVREGGVLKNHESIRQDNARQALEDFIKLADQNNLEVIVDIHSCSNYLGWRAGRLDSKPPYSDADRKNYEYTREGYSCSATGNPSSVIQVDAYDESKWLQDLQEIAGLSEKLGVDNIIAIDIFNEPWDYTWAEWKTLSEKAYEAISAVNDDVLIMVEGIAAKTNDGTEIPHGSTDTNPNWGENFYPAADAPLNIPKERLLLSPHTYGPSVFVQAQFVDQSKPGCEGLEGPEAGDAGCDIVISGDKLEPGWDEHFGYLRDQGFGMLVGEFGGAIDWPQGSDNGYNWNHINEKVDLQWQEAFVDYMIKKDIEACYWSINPESADTGGLYDHAYSNSNESGWGEWLDFNQTKVNLLKRLWGY